MAEKHWTPTWSPNGTVLIDVTNDKSRWHIMCNVTAGTFEEINMYI